MKPTSGVLGRFTSLLLGALFIAALPRPGAAQDAPVPLDAGDGQFVDMARLRAQYGLSLIHI